MLTAVGLGGRSLPASSLQELPTVQSCPTDAACVAPAKLLRCPAGLPMPGGAHATGIQCSLVRHCGRCQLSGTNWGRQRLLTCDFCTKGQIICEALFREALLPMEIVRSSHYTRLPNPLTLDIACSSDTMLGPGCAGSLQVTVPSSIEYSGCSMLWQVKSEQLWDLRKSNNRICMGCSAEDKAHTFKSLTRFLLLSWSGGDGCPAEVQAAAEMPLGPVPGLRLIGKLCRADCCLHICIQRQLSTYMCTRPLLLCCVH